MKAAVIAVEGPPIGKDHHTPERYLDDVLEGARLIEGQCSKDIIFEWMYLNDPDVFIIYIKALWCICAIV